MPKVKRATRRPVKRQRLAGLTVTIQRTKKEGYAATVVMRRDGRRIRERYLATMEEAEGLAQKWSIEAGNAGAEAAATITDSDRRFLMEARRKLAPLGKTLEDAVTHFLDHMARCKTTITVSALSDRFQTAKIREGKSRRYLDDLRHRLAKFCDSFGERLAAEITTDEISAWLLNLNAAPITTQNYRRVVSSVFSFGVAMKACSENPVNGSHLPSNVEGEVGILTVTQAEKLLRSAAQEPEILPVVALGLFCGIRDAELKRLDWADINFESGFVEIRASKSKSARRRLIPIRPALRQWIEPLRALSGSVAPEQEGRGRRLLEEVKRAAGFGPVGHKSEGAESESETLIPWPHNALRHSFASYHLGRWKDAPALALEMGHASPQMIFAHYRELVLPAQAEAYWKIQPRPAAEILNFPQRCTA